MFIIFFFSILIFEKKKKKSYGNQLSALIEFYLKPMREKKIVSPEEIKTIFGNIEVIYEIHLIFLEGLNNSTKSFKTEVLISPNFLKMTDSLK